MCKETQCAACLKPLGDTAYVRVKNLVVHEECFWQASPEQPLRSWKAFLDLMGGAPYLVAILSRVVKDDDRRRCVAMYNDELLVAMVGAVHEKVMRMHS